MRAMNATEKAASVKAGSMIESGPEAPAAGSHRSWIENRMMSIRPSQYTGMLMPNSTSADTARSARLPARAAASAPSGRPTATATARLTTASSAV